MGPMTMSSSCRRRYRHSFKTRTSKTSIQLPYGGRRAHTIAVPVICVVRRIFPWPKAGISNTARRIDPSKSGYRTRNRQTFVLVCGPAQASDLKCTGIRHSFRTTLTCLNHSSFNTQYSAYPFPPDELDALLQPLLCQTRTNVKPVSAQPLYKMKRGLQHLRELLSS